jgi:hypothetical protein
MQKPFSTEDRKYTYEGQVSDGFSLSLDPEGGSRNQLKIPQQNTKEY